MRHADFRCFRDAGDCLMLSADCHFAPPRAITPLTRDSMLPIFASQRWY